jgi:hypothetical protein
MKNNYDELRSIIGGCVRRLGVLVWPDSGGLKSTDVQLHLEVECADGICRELTCRTDDDGQSLRIESEQWLDALPFSKLEERVRVWSSPEFWNQVKEHSYELFETAEERSFGIGSGSVVTAVHLVQFAEDQKDVTGLVVEFDSLIRLWSGPSANGNYVSTNPDDFVWPTEIELMPIT